MNAGYLLQNEKDSVRPGKPDFLAALSFYVHKLCAQVMCTGYVHWGIQKDGAFGTRAG